LVEVGLLPVSLSRVKLGALYDDRAGALWIGTLTDGLFRFDGTGFAPMKAHRIPRFGA